MAGMSDDTVDLAPYEGLVYKTAEMYERLLGYEREDLQQVLRLRVFIAIKAFDPRRSTIPIERFVFGAIRNQIKDLVKAKTRRDRHGAQVYIEDYRSDYLGGSTAFDAEHLSTLDLHQRDESVILPETLTQDEREVIALLYVGYRQTEIAALLECQRRDIERRVRDIKRKLVDWQPSASGDAEIIELESRVRRVLQRAAA